MGEKKGLISVIVPVYNVEPYLRQCIDSICQQSYPNLEIILVDDGSKDRSGQICDAYAREDKRITVIHKENRGLSSARNEGMKRAHGTYIGFVDSDDWIAPDMYESLQRLMEQCQADISVCGIQREEAYALPKRRPFDFGDVQIYSSKEYQKKILKVGTQDSNHYADNKLYKLEKMKGVFYPEGLIDEDVEGTFLAVLNVERIVVSNSPAYYYRINPSSITACPFSKRQMDFLTICDRVYAISKDRCDKDIQQAARLFRMRADLALLCRMAISEIEEGYCLEAKKDAEEMVENLRRNFWHLARANIPFSRKVLLVFFCLNKDMAFKLVGLAKKWINGRRKRMA